MRSGLERSASIGRRHAARADRSPKSAACVYEECRKWLLLRFSVTSARRRSLARSSLAVRLPSPSRSPVPVAVSVSIGCRCRGVADAVALPPLRRLVACARVCLSSSLFPVVARGSVSLFRARPDEFLRRKWPSRERESSEDPRNLSSGNRTGAKSRRLPPSSSRGAVPDNAPASSRD